MVVERVNWVSINPPASVVHALVKIRSRHEGGAASISVLGDDRVRVEFEEPQSAITPGQAAVFYDGDVVLGGGWIAKDAAASDQ